MYIFGMRSIILGLRYRSVQSVPDSTMEEYPVGSNCEPCVGVQAREPAHRATPGF